MTRRLGIAALAAAIAMVAIAIAIHTPPFRGFVLRYALRTVQERYGIRVEAARLDYNLASLRFALSGVAVSAPGEPVPFFAADRVEATLGRTALLGNVVFDEVATTNARVRILRRVDGRTNLPPSSGSTGEPAPLRIARISAPHLRVDVRDEQSDLTIAIPDLVAQMTAKEGRIAFGAPAQITYGQTTTRIARLAGDASFDGRDLHLGNLQVATTEGTVRSDGVVRLIRRDPGVDLTIDATVDARQAARWGMPLDAAPRGAVKVSGRVAGAFSALSADLQLASERIDWAPLSGTSVRARTSLTADRLDVTDASFLLEGGRVSARASVPFDRARPSEVHATWSAVDAQALAGRFVSGRLRPVGAISGELDASGAGDARQWTGDVRLRVGAARNARDRLALPGDLRLHLQDGSWRMTAQHRVGNVAPVTATLGGRLAAGDLARTPVSGTVQLDATDLPVLLRMLGDVGLASVPPDLVTAGTIEGAAVVSGSLAGPRLRFRANTIEAAGASGATGHLAATGEYDVARAAYDVAATLTDWRLAAQPDRPLTAVVDGRVALHGNGDRIVGDGDFDIRDAGWANIGIGTITAQVKLADDLAHITAAAPDFDVTADADVRLASPYQTTLTAVTSNLDLARALRDVPTPESIGGRMAARLDAAGPLQEWRRGSARLEVTTLEGQAGDLQLRLTEPARVTYQRERVAVERLEAAAGGTRLSVAGALPLASGSSRADRDDALIATITGDVGEIARAVRATKLADVPELEATGPVVLLARVTGTLDAPAYAGDLELGPAAITIREGMPPATDVRVRAHLDRDVLELREATANYEGATLTADGHAPLAIFTQSGPTAGDAVLHARAVGITPQVLRGYVDPAMLENVSATVDASLDVTSPTLTADDVTGELRLDRFDVAIANLPLTQRQPTRIRLDNGFARIESWDWSGEGGSIALRGQVRLRDREAAILANGDIDLRLLTPFVSSAGVSIAGRLEPRLSLTGTLEAPRVDGDAMLGGGEVRIANPRVVLGDLAGRIALTRTSAHLVSLTGTANGGALQATGSVEYGPEAPLETSLTGTVKGMALEFPEGLRTEVDATLALALRLGTPDSAPSGTLSGTATVLRGAYRDPLPVVAGLLASVRARSATTTDAPSPLMSALALDVRVVTDDDLIVDNNVARLQMGGDLRVIGTAAAPALSGRVDLREGGQLYLGRNVYRVDTGTIDFSNPLTIEPDLNITATTRVAGNEVQVRLMGTPETLSPELSSPSNPSLGQADLASLLLTGRTLDALSSDQAAAIGADVLGNLSGDVLGFASRAVGLDVIRIGGIDTAGARSDTTTVATEVDPTARLTFGKTLGHNVDVTFSQSLRDGDAQTWIVDYLPTRQLALRLVSNDEDLRSYEFRHDLSFGGTAARANRPTASSRPTPAPRVSSVTLRGELAFPEAQLRARLSLSEGDRFDFIAWQTDRDRLQDFYIEQRHLAARVTASRQGDAASVALTYDIAAGPETAIRITGATLDRSVIGRLESAWATSVFDGFLVDEARDIVRTAVTNDGYARPLVRASIETSGAVRTLAIDVEPGEKGAAAPEPAVPAATERRPAVGTVTFVHAAANDAERPALQVPPDALRSAAGLSPGTPVDPLEVDEARQRVQALYRREGFASARVTARQSVRTAEGVMDVTFDIDEGPRQVVGEVVVSGNRGIDADVITRALRLESGQPLRVQDWLDARRRVFDTGLFRRVDLSSEPMGDAAAASPMRVRVVVEEWPALRLRYGFQAAEERPEGSLSGRDIVPGVTADVTRRTLFGRPVAVGGAIELQRRDRSARGFLNAPTLMGRPVSSSFVVERSREEFAAATLVTSRGGVSWEQRARTLRNRLNVSYTYRFERNHTFDTEPTPGFPAFDITINIARLTMAAAWDTRDDAADTTRGSLLSFTFEDAPESLGSDIRFVRNLVQAYHFRRWRDVVVGSAARIGIVQPLGGQELISSLRFFAGGARTVRGVPEDGLGPRDFFGDPAGGEALVVLNQEVRFPIYRWLRGAGFLDVGNVYRRPEDFGFDKLVGSVGAGLRFVTPVALLRVDYGKKVWPGPRTESGQWFFGLGQSF